MLPHPLVQLEHEIEGAFGGPAVRGPGERLAAHTVGGGEAEEFRGE